MGEQNLPIIEDKELLLDLLAKKLKAKPKAVSFLFGANRNNEEDFAIPDIRARLD